MVSEWDTLLAEEEIVQSTLVFDRYKLRVWRLFTHNWTIFPPQTTATNYGWILRITSVGDLFPAVLGHLLCVWGSCTHIPMEVHNESVKKKQLQQDLLLLCECGHLTVFSVKGQRSNFVQLKPASADSKKRVCCYVFQSHSTHASLIMPHWVHIALQVKSECFQEK